MKRGRKNKYETDVKPYFYRIIKWLENGATERQVAQNLGIGYSTFNRYKGEKEELRELIKKSRQNVVMKLRGALIERALGFDYEESKIVKEQVDFPEDIKKYLLESGFTEEQINQSKLVKTEISKKHALPDVAALNLALKNYDKENWANDPQMLAIRKRELELREQQIENNVW